jgi:hypothetical protein
MATELSHGWSGHLFPMYLLTRNTDHSGGKQPLTVSIGQFTLGKERSKVSIKLAK